VASNASDGPLIGLTTYVEPARHGAWDEVCALLPVTYISAVTRSGGIPVLLPPTPSDPGVVLGALSGLVVTGGPDVDPSLYGAEAHTETDRPRPERDAWESALCMAAVEVDMPLLAVCRGLQVMNVALGGTLHQHLPEITGTEAHRQVRGTMSPVAISVAPDSVLASVVGTSTEGLCHHHQSVDHLGQGLRSVAQAADGTIEAAEVPGRRFALGVQWHPETDPADDRLFEALVQAASDYRTASHG